MDEWDERDQNDPDDPLNRCENSGVVQRLVGKLFLLLVSLGEERCDI